jgi:hypothetical protein
VSTNQWATMVCDISTMDLKILRSRAAFSGFLVTLLKAFHHYHDHSVRVAKAAIRVRTHEVDRVENSQLSSGQSESEDEDEDEDGVGLGWCYQRLCALRFAIFNFLALLLRGAAKK